MHTKTEQKPSFKTLFFNNKYSDLNIVNLANKLQDMELLNFIAIHEERLRMMSSVDLIQKLIIRVMNNTFKDDNSNVYYKDNMDETRKLMQQMVNIFKCAI